MSVLLNLKGEVEGVRVGEGKNILPISADVLLRDVTDGNVLVEELDEVKLDQMPDKYNINRTLETTLK